jgi:transcriptional regulator with XRE-family HTH domain
MVYDPMAAFGTCLRDRREQHGLDQATLARRAGTTQTYISRIERGDVSPSERTMRRLLHAMGLQLVLETRVLARGNISLDEVRADYRNLTPAERIEQTMELSSFLSDVAERAADAAK